MTSNWVAVGVDWANGHWVAVVDDATGCPTVRLYDSMTALWEACASTQPRILVDMPIGLCDSASAATNGCRTTDGEQSRLCDDLARAILGPRSASIFTPPCREAVVGLTEGDLSYAEASTLNQSHTGKGLMRQAAHIAPGIRDVEQVLDTWPDARTQLIESHPEVCFRALAAQPLQYSKRTAAGAAKRLTILEDGPGPYTTGQWRSLASTLSSEVAVDDLLDAIVLAVTAMAPPKEFQTLPADPPSDAQGLPMQIAYRRKQPFDPTQPA